MASAYLHTKVRPGDLLDVAAARGTFVLRTGSGAGGGEMREARRGG
jgi:ferredoxin-NADP reductase